MDRTRYQRIRSLFHRASDLDPAARERLLDDQAEPDLARAVRALLAEEPRPDTTASWQADAGRAALQALEPLPERVGPYRLLGLLGEGGMGVVHEAEQDEPRRRVAVKLLRPGLADPRALERFREEAAILGRLAHHGVAQVLQAGEDGGRPWIAMELVRGLALDEHVVRHDPDLATRCRLLLSLCEAVAHAHRHGVVHRDLKAANVLVPDDGEDPARRTAVKVLDFGIARLSAAEAPRHTEAGRLVGSLSAMSPEQVRGRGDAVDTRSDVWSLGVLAYTVLAGAPPFDLEDCGLPEAARRLCEDEPLPLGRHDRSLRGDLEAVVAKALDKDPARRHDGAAALGDDLRRVLAHEPVSARRLTAGYQLARLARRHRALVAGLVLALLGLTGGLAAALRQAARAEAALEEATTDADIAATVTAFMIESFELADPSLAGRRDLPVRDALDVARARLDSGLARRPEVLPDVLASFGRTYAAVGDDGPAEELAREAVARALAVHGADSPRTRRARVALAEVLERGAHWPEAVAAWRAVGGVRAVDGLRPEEQLALARCLAHLGDPVASAAVLARVPVAPDDGELAVLRAEARAELDRLEGRWAAAAEGLAGAVAQRELQGDDPLRIAGARARLAVALRGAGAHAEAEAAAAQALRTTRAVLGEDHPQTAARLSALGAMLRDLGRPDEALEHQDQARERLARRLGADHALVGAVEGHRGLALLDLGRLDEAQAAFARALDLCPEDLPVERAAWLHDRADALAGLGRRDEAAALLERSLELLLDSVGPDHPHVATTWNSQAGLLLDAGRPDQAVPLLERVRAHRLEHLGPEHPETIQAGGNLGWLLHAAGRTDEALPLLRQAWAGDVAVRGADHPAAIQSGVNLGLALIAAGATAEAREVLVEVSARHGAVHGEDHPQTLAMRRWLAESGGPGAP